jgi:hypothetical protein
MELMASPSSVGFDLFMRQVSIQAHSYPSFKAFRQKLRAFLIAFEVTISRIRELLQCDLFILLAMGWDGIGRSFAKEKFFQDEGSSVDEVLGEMGSKITNMKM